MTPFVKWAGGKTQLLDVLKKYIPPTFGTYYEPFVGGGAFLLSLQPNKAVISDVNEQLINVYKHLKTDFSSVIATLKRYDSVQCDKFKYLLLRQSYNEKIISNALDVECAALTIWLNKHCFNGLYRVNSKGLFNVPYNNKTNGSSTNEDNLRRVCDYLANSDIEITHGDFENTCANVKSGDFVYFDPPYVPISETANFTAYTKNKFSIEDQKRLANLFKRLDSIGAFVVLSNNDTPLIRDLYKTYFFTEINVRRNINCTATKRTGNEILVSNYMPTKFHCLTN